MGNWFENMKSDNSIIAQAQQAPAPAPNPSGSPGSPGAGVTPAQPAAPSAAGAANANTSAAVPPNSQQDQAAQNKQGQAPAQVKIKGEDELFKAYPAIKTVVDWIANAKNVANHIQPAEGYLKNVLAELKNKGVIDDVLWKQITERKPGQ